MSADRSVPVVRTVDCSKLRSGFVEGPINVAPGKTLDGRFTPYGTAAATDTVVELVESKSPLGDHRAAFDSFSTPVSATVVASSSIARPVDVTANVSKSALVDADVTTAATAGEGAYLRFEGVIKATE